MTVDRVLGEVRDELERAVRQHGPMASPHEGKAVIEEELDELWEHVKADTGRGPEARAEALQVAAMALRYVHDLCEVSGPKCFNHDTPDCPICLKWAAAATCDRCGHRESEHDHTGIGTACRHVFPDGTGCDCPEYDVPPVTDLPTSPRDDDEIPF